MKYNFKALPIDPWEGVKIAQDDLDDMGEGGEEDLDELFAGDNLTIGSGPGLMYDKTQAEAGESEVALDLLGLGQNVGDVYDATASVQRKAPFINDEDDEGRGPFLDEAEPGDSEYPLADDPVVTERWDKPDLGGGYDEYEYEDRFEDDMPEDEWPVPEEEEGDPDADIWYGYREPNQSWTGAKHKSFAAAKKAVVDHGVNPERIQFIRVRNGKETVIDAIGGPVRPT